MNIRKSASQLSSTEWANYMNACVALKHTFSAGSSISVYDQFVAIHIGVAQLRSPVATGPAAGIDGAHRNPGFLPWHREYLRRFEKALQSIDSSVTIPYWNWGLESDALSTSIFTPDKVGPMGSGPNLEVSDGYLARNPNAFNSQGWQIHPDLRRRGIGLQRNAVLNTTTSDWPTGMSVGGVLAAANFNLFFPLLENTPHHNSIHGIVGRDMAAMSSPNDPVFFMHHAQVDRLWAKWQESHPGSANYNPMGMGGQGHRLNDLMWPWDGGQSSPGIVVSPSWPFPVMDSNLVPTYASNDLVRPIDVINHHDLGYCYDDDTNSPCNCNNEDEVTTMALLEETITSIPQLEELPPITTFVRGEEDPVTTLMIGEEGPGTTFRIGEEGPIGSTLRLGEEGGPPTDPRIDDPSPIDPRRPRVASPFGNF